MNRYFLMFAFSVGLVSGVFFYVSAQEAPVLTASLSSTTPASQIITAGSQLVDVAKITLKATGDDVYITGIYLATDVAGGLSNFSDLYLYSIYNSNLTFVGTYPTQSANPNWIEFGSPLKISKDGSKTYVIQASLSSSASGNIRVGFSGFTFATEVAPTLVNVPIYGNTMALPGGTLATPTPTPAPTATPTPLASPEPSAPAGSPSSTPSLPISLKPSELGFTSLSALNLSEGDTISATGSSDPDIYIANAWGYKRLFLNPVIFGFYGHLGGFANVKTITSTTRAMLVTSALFRNCENGDEKVYGLEVTGEDSGTLHWVNTSGAQAIADDSEFFKKVFCINSAEFNWYSQGSVYTSVLQVPTYSR